MKIAILGGGESGVGSAILAQAHGYDVFLSDYGQIKDVYRQMLTTHNISWEEGGHTESLILDADEVIKSPGIADETPIVEKIIASHIPVLSEIEFAQRFTSAKMICITGSNGRRRPPRYLLHTAARWLQCGSGWQHRAQSCASVLENKTDYYVY